MRILLLFILGIFLLIYLNGCIVIGYGIGRNSDYKHFDELNVDLDNPEITIRSGYIVFIDLSDGRKCMGRVTDIDWGSYLEIELKREYWHLENQIPSLYDMIRDYNPGSNFTGVNGSLMMKVEWENLGNIYRIRIPSDKRKTGAIIGVCIDCAVGLVMYVLYSFARGLEAIGSTG